MQLRVKMPRKSGNNVFIRKQTTNKAPATIVRGFAVGKKVRFVFSKPKNKTKVEWNIFSRSKITRRCPWCIYSVDCNRIDAANAITS